MNDPSPHDVFAPQAQDVFANSPMPEPSQSEAIAGQVIDDLDSMKPAFDTPPDPANWQLDDTFPAPAAGSSESPSASEDPFGDISGLIEDESDRGSVMNFLRRD